MKLRLKYLAIALTLAVVAVLATPGTASAECIPVPYYIWQYGEAYIYMWLYYQGPDLLMQAIYSGDPLNWIVGHTCAQY